MRMRKPNINIIRVPWESRKNKIWGKKWKVFRVAKDIDQWI